MVVDKRVARPSGWPVRVTQLTSASQIRLTALSWCIAGFLLSLLHHCPDIIFGIGVSGWDMDQLQRHQQTTKAAFASLHIVFRLR